MRTIHEKKDDLCSHTERLASIELDLPTIANGVKNVENKTDVVSSFVSRLDECVEDIGVIIANKADKIQKAEEERLLAELKEQEER